MHDLGGSTNSLIWEEATAINFGEWCWRRERAGNPSLHRREISKRCDLCDGPLLVISSVGMGFRDHVTGYHCIVRMVVSQWTKLNGVPGLEFATFPRAMNRYGHVAGEAGSREMKACTTPCPLPRPRDRSDSSREGKVANSRPGTPLELRPLRHDILTISDTRDIGHETPSRRRE